MGQINPTFPTPGGNSGTWGADLNAALNTMVAGINDNDAKRLVFNQLNSQSGTTYTLQNSDQTSLVEMTGSASTITVPAGLTWLNNSEAVIIQQGTGQVTISPATGVTIYSPTGTFTSRAQYGRIILRKRGTDSYILAGDLTPAVAFAPLASPTFTGTPAAPTPATSDSSTTVATTAFVKAQGYAPLASPTFTGTPVVPGYAPLASPTFTGTPAAPTPAASDSSTTVATTAFVRSSTPRTYNVAASATGTNQYIRIATATVPGNGAGAEFNLLISGLGHITTGARSTYAVTLGLYGNSATTSTAQLSYSLLTQQNDPAVAFYTRQTGNFVWEVWALLSTYQNAWTVTVLSGSNFAINLDSISTTAPSSPALTQVLIPHQTVQGKQIRVFRNSNLSLAASTGTQVPVDTLQYNDDGLYYAQSGSGVQIKIAGLYLVSYVGNVNTTSASLVLSMYVTVNGATFNESASYISSGYGARINGSTAYRFSANDVVKLMGYATSAATLGGSTDQKDVGLSIVRLGL